jgi:hypothetical protein
MAASTFSLAGKTLKLDSASEGEGRGCHFGKEFLGVKTRFVWGYMMRLSPGVRKLNLGLVAVATWFGNYHACLI